MAIADPWVGCGHHSRHRGLQSRRSVCVWMSHTVMPLQRARLSEGDAADAAREGLFARVAPLVHDEV